MNTIIDPITGNHLNLFSTDGKNLLKQFVKMYQSGGAGRNRPDNLDFERMGSPKYEHGSPKFAPASPTDYRDPSTPPTNDTNTVRGNSSKTKS